MLSIFCNAILNIKQGLERIFCGFLHGKLKYYFLWGFFLVLFFLILLTINIYFLMLSLGK